MLYYLSLAALTVAVTVAVLTTGAGREAEPEIAGTYRIESGAACLGAEADVLQSGQFI